MSEPCPFCGGRDIFLPEEEGECRDCGATGPTGGNGTWSTRADGWVSVDTPPEGDSPIHVQIAARSPEGKLYVSAASYLLGYGGFDHWHDPIEYWKPLDQPPEGI